MILEKFLNENNFNVDYDIPECPISETILITPDLIGLENINAMNERERINLDKEVLYEEAMIYIKSLQGVNVSLLMENVIMDFFSKLKELIKKAWARMKSWFESTNAQIVIQAKNAEDKLENTRQKLLNMDLSKFKYTIHTGNINNSNTKAIANKIIKNTEKDIQSVKGLIDKELADFNNAMTKKIMNGELDAEAKTRKIDLEEDTTFSDFKNNNKRIAKFMGSSSDEMTIEEAKDELSNQIEGEPKEVTGLQKATIEKLISTIKNFNDNEILENIKKSYESNYSKISKEVDDIQNKLKSTKKDGDEEIGELAKYHIIKIRMALAKMVDSASICNKLLIFCIDREKAKFMEARTIIYSAAKYKPEQ